MLSTLPSRFSARYLVLLIGASTILACFTLLLLPGLAGKTAIARPTSPQDDKKILTVPGDIHRPYEIIDAVAFVKGVEVEVLSLGGISGAYNKTLQESFELLEKSAKKAGADAVINMQLQFVLSPGSKGREQEVGQLMVFGTMVKYKP